MTEDLDKSLAKISDNIDAMKAEIDRLKKALNIAVPLLQETICQHSDMDAPEYNECDRSRCQWCEHASIVVAMHCAT